MPPGAPPCPDAAGGIGSPLAPETSGRIQEYSHETQHLAPARRDRGGHRHRAGRRPARPRGGRARRGHSHRLTLGVQTSPFSSSGTAATANSATNPVTDAGLGKIGLTGSGRANISTGLQYVEAQSYADSPYHTRAYVKLAAPVTGTTRAQTYSASSSVLRVQCLSDAKGTPSGSVQIDASVPAGIGNMPAPGTTVYYTGGKPFGTTAPTDKWEIKVVWNEQTTLANGQLQVIGMHTYYNVPKKLLSEAITGDVALGIVTCGKVTNAPDPEPIPVADPKLAGGAAALALAGGTAFLVTRRRPGNQEQVR